MHPATNFTQSGFDHPLRRFGRRDEAIHAMQGLMALLIGHMQAFFGHSVTMVQEFDKDPDEITERRALVKEVEGIPTSGFVCVLMTMTEQVQDAAAAVQWPNMYEIYMFILIDLKKFPFNKLHEANEILYRNCTFNNEVFIKSGGLRYFLQGMLQQFSHPFHFTLANIVNDQGIQQEMRLIDIPGGRQVQILIVQNRIRVQLLNGPATRSFFCELVGCVTLEHAQRMVSKLRSML